VAAAAIDRAQLLKFAGCLGDTRAPHAEHAGDEFLRHDQLVRRCPIEREQQPATELLQQRMVAIAHRRLRHLSQDRLRVAKQQPQQQPEAIELLHQQSRRQLVAVARGLHQRPARSRLATHEKRDAEHPFPADAGYFRGGAVLRQIVQ
jgi:hypothetical protein